MEIFSGDTRTNDLQGSMRSTAPELFRLDEPRTYASDVYAFSCLCLEVSESFHVMVDPILIRLRVEAYTGHPPFWDIAHEVTIVLDVMAGKRPRRPSVEECGGRQMSNSMWDLIQECWTSEPANRPVIQDVIKRLEGITIPRRCIIHFHLVDSVRLIIVCAVRGCQCRGSPQTRRRPSPVRA